MSVCYRHGCSLTVFFCQVMELEWVKDVPLQVSCGLKIIVDIIRMWCWS